MTTSKDAADEFAAEERIAEGLVTASQKLTVQWVQFGNG